MPLFIARESEEPKVQTLSVTPGLSCHEFFGNHDQEHPTCCGIGVSEPGVSASFKYPCYEYAIIMEGEGEVTDDSTGETRAVKRGDVIHVEAGTPATWKATTKMKTFYVSAKECGNSEMGLL
ncbi:hypothetical protein FS749_010787 [Ceratobasidium sp. UAMH 11750]|nr:hypothetical protein FS749_010787 [Ceratobasidium sp. UAMH 11750]